MAILVSAVLIVIAIPVAATVVITAALRAALATFVATATAAGTLLVTTGYAGFATVLATLVPMILTLAAIFLGGLGLLFLFSVKEAGNLPAQAAEQAFFRLGSFGFRLGCRRRCWCAGANRPHGCLFANRFFRGWSFENLLFTLAVFLGHLVAGNVLGRRFIVTHPDNFEVRCFHVRNRNHHDADFLTRFDIGQLLAFFVQQESSHRHRNNGANFARLVF